MYNIQIVVSMQCYTCTDVTFVCSVLCELFMYRNIVSTFKHELLKQWHSFSETNLKGKN